MSSESKTLHSQIRMLFAQLKSDKPVDEIKIDKAEINKKNSNGEIPLHLVVKDETLKINETQTIISDQKRQGQIEINEKNQIKNKKILQKQLELIEQLKTSDLTVQNYKKNKEDKLQPHQTPLHIVASHPNKEILEKILQVFPQEEIKNAAVLQDQDGNTPLHLAIKHYAEPEFIKKLFVGKYDNRGLGNLNLVDSKGNTPLHIAVENSNAGIAESLIQAGADVNVKDSKGNTPLHIAVEKGNKKLVERLIQAEAVVNDQNSEGNTPLHIAVKNGNKELVKCLIQNNRVNKDIQNNNGDTPLDLAIANKHAAIAIELYQHGAQCSYHNVIEQCELEPLKNYVSAQKKFENFNTKILLANVALALVLGSFILTKEFSENQDILDAVAPVENIMGNLGAAELALVLMGTSIIIIAIISYCWKNHEQSAAIEQASSTSSLTK